MSRRRPFRYTLILASVAASTVLAAAGGWRYARASAPLSGPIIVVSIDTLRADHLPAYGYKKVRTPAIDLLASNGVVFERAYSHVPDTLAAHVSLLSGRLPFETGVRGGNDDHVKPGERLLAQMLHDRGYATAGVISASALGKETGISQGFDVFDDDIPQAELMPTAGIAERDGAESEKIAERWLDSIGTSRGFLFLHLYEPHKPYAPHEAYSAYSPYDGEIAYADEIVGRLIHYLKSHQLYDRSTIVLLSDNGEGLGDHGEQEHGLFSYEESIHIPLIVKQESEEGAGRRVHDIVQHIDLVPTILDLVKAPIPAPLRGRSLKPLLDGSGRLPDRAIYSEALYAHLHFGWSELAGLSDGNYHYIRTSHEELYDLRRDPRERTNLLEDGHPAASELDRKAGATLAAALRRLAPVSSTLNAADNAVSTEPAADPKDKRAFVEAYRAALDAASRHEWPQAIDLLQRTLRSQPDAAEAWSALGGLASLMSRDDLALEAYHRVIELRPLDPTGYLGAAEVLFKERKLDDARAEAAAVLDQTSDSDPRARASAHALLARIALAKRDADQARVEAGLAHQSDPLVPLPAFVEARVLYDQGKYEEALPFFEDAVAAARKVGSPLENLHFYAGDTFQKLDRQSEAEAEWLEELRLFPHNLRAVTALVMMYQTMDRRDEAETIIMKQLGTTPTPESYALAARLLKALGNTRQANAVRAEAARTFASRRPATAPESH